MERKKLAALAALLCVAVPGHAWEPRDPVPSTMFYVSIPLDARTPKEQSPVLGFSVQGKREYEALNLDTRIFHLTPLGGLEVKWVAAGAAALVAVAAVGSKGKGVREQEQAQEQARAQAQQQQQQQPCQRTC